jgi:hypothetical protein
LISGEDTRVAARNWVGLWSFKIIPFFPGFWLFLEVVNEAFPDRL